MEFRFGIVGSSGNGISSEIPVETSSVAMVVPSSPIPFGASVGAATMTSLSMPSSIFGSALDPFPDSKPQGITPSIIRTRFSDRLWLRPRQSTLDRTRAFPHWST
ncbi:unnamed protein product [Cuscuta campestris]|uniref:Uncharacterized protein n=1 Tax=Cuscuta campestris TaxID=132261 RepID=A0A484N7C0_9ASTE|nr:unnamed protein product [Cuscuta campestris]